MSLVHLGRSSVAPAVPVPLAGAPAVPKDYFEGLTKYIPGETLTLFVAAMAVIKSLDAMSISNWHVYVTCAVLTPGILWVSAYGTYLSKGGAGPFPLPWWRMLAATLAFLVWSLSIPPMLDDMQRPIAGLGALFISTFLTLFDPIFDH
jgi:hypothetical protein